MMEIISKGQDGLHFSSGLTNTAQVQWLDSTSFVDEGVESAVLELGGVAMVLEGSSDKNSAT